MSPLAFEPQEAVAVAVTLELFNSNQGSLNAVIVERYLTYLGFVLLVYDHVNTLSREIEVVWKAKPSFSKYAFLVNRYMVPCAMIPAIWHMSGFVGNPVTNRACVAISTVDFVLAILSVALANGLILSRVVALWEHRRMVSLILAATFACSYAAVIGMLIATIPKVVPGIMYNPIAGMCVPTTTTSFLKGIWASALPFDVIVLGATCVNAIDRPRRAHEPVIRMLRRDGIVFFASITALRIVNLALAFTNDPKYAFIAIYFIWQIVTLLVSRMLLRLGSLDKTSVALPALKSPTRLRNSVMGQRRGSTPMNVDGMTSHDDWEIKSTEVGIDKVELIVVDRDWPRNSNGVESGQ